MSGSACRRSRQIIIEFEQEPVVGDMPDFSETVSPGEIDFNNPPVQSEMIISINGVPLGTQRNLSGITGGEGMGKNNLCGKPDCLTSMSRKERMQAIVQSMDRFYYQFNGIQMVVIDGIADLVRCANDEAESVGVIDELYRLADIYKTCIVYVLHFIPNGMKLRGHLGSELQRKAVAILSIEKDENPLIS